MSLVDRAPNMPDHTFPATGGCKLIPAGYMPLRVKPMGRRSRSLTPEQRINLASFQRSRSHSPSQRPISAYSFRDTSRRERIKWPRTGELHIALLSARFCKTTSSRHAEGIKKFLRTDLLPSGRRVLILLTDGGPDWNGKSLLNIFNYGKLWVDLRLDALILLRYAPRHSKYNPIERRWAPLTRKLSQVWLVAPVYKFYNSKFYRKKYHYKSDGSGGKRMRMANLAGGKILGKLGR